VAEAAAPTAGGGLPPVVKTLGAVSLFNDLASEMVYPLLPALVTRGLGAGALALGALDGIADAVSAVVKVAAGWLGERRAWRRPLIVGGYALAAVTRPLMGLSAAAWQVVALRAADRMGKGGRNPPRDTLIADAVDAHLRGRAFGFHRAMDHAGAVVGPLVATALIALWAWTPRRVIVWSAVPGVVTVLLAIVALRRAPAPVPVPVPAPPPASPAPAPAGPMLAGGAPPTALIVLIMLFAFARLPETLLLLRLQDRGVPVAVVPIIWALLHVVRSASSYPGGWIADRIGPARTMVGGWGVYAVVCAGLALTRSPVTAGTWLLAYGLVAAATESPERMFVAAWGARATRGRRFGLYHAGVGLAALPGGLALGALYAWRGGTMALLVSGAATGALALAGLAGATRERAAR
jgi:MFS family permease